MDETAVLRSLAVPLAGADPALPEGDLAPLLARLASARLVGLGEATHGDHESFAFKRRLIQALVRRHACDIVIFERGVAEMDAYDRYVTGQTPTLTMGNDLYPWRTEEVRDLFVWLRDWNSKGGTVRLAGMDMQSPAGLALALQCLDDAAISAPGIWRQLADESSQRSSGLPRTPDEIVWYEAAHATFRPAEAPLNPPENPQARWIQLLTTTFGQWLDYWPKVRQSDAKPWELRDRCMAENALAQLDRFGPAARAVMWAHNGHVCLIPANAGGQLRARLGPAYRSVCFAFGRGMFNAGSVPVDADTGAPGPIDWTLRPHAAQPPPPGSMEHHFDQLDLDCYAVEPAQVEALRRETLVREVGAALADGPVQFSFRCVPADVYDLLVYFRQAHPSHLLEAP